MANWTPGGYGGAFLQLLSRHTSAGADASLPPPFPATAWGEPDRVHDLLGDAVDQLRCETRFVALDFTGTPQELLDLYWTSFGPILTVRAACADLPSTLAALKQDLLEFLSTHYQKPVTPTGSGSYLIDYLAVTATRNG